MKIIHVDMNKFALQAMQKELPQIAPGAELRSFNHPGSVLTYAEAHGCDVLLTKIEFWSDPRGGVRPAKAMKKLNRYVNIVFVTVYSESEVARALFELSGSVLLPKPWATENLAAAFQNLR